MQINNSSWDQILAMHKMQRTDNKGNFASLATNVFLGRVSFIRWRSPPVQMILESKWMCCLEHPWRSILKLKMGRGTHRETQLVHIGFSVSCPYSGSWSAPLSLLCVLGTLWTQPTPGIIKIPKTRLNQDQYVFPSSFWKPGPLWIQECTQFNA